jgi:hypothetical protein
MPNLPWSESHLALCLQCFESRRPALVPAARAQLERFRRVGPRTIGALQQRAATPVGPGGR